MRILENLDAVDPGEWDTLAGGNPTLRYAFLDSLHRTGCASALSSLRAPNIEQVFDSIRVDVIMCLGSASAPL